MNLRAMSRSGAGSRARHRLRGPRVWLLALLVAGAIVLRDSAGVLLAIMALLVLVDAAVPVPGDRWAQADARFRLLCRRRRSGARMRRLRGLGPEQLEVLDDRGGWAATAQRRAVGVESIPLDSITGTVEDAKAATFDRSFRPDVSSAGRWQYVWLAQRDGIALPPIAVYRVGERHILRDGHHRVSAARDHGWSAIDAEVVELRPPARPEAAAA
jgi:hypothetical protein